MKKNSDAVEYTKEEYMIRKCETADILKEGSTAESIWYYIIAPRREHLRQLIVKDFALL